MSMCFRTIVLRILPAFALASFNCHAADVAGSVLQYEETESGTAPYPVRIIATSGYLRIDDGNDDGDYILLDRKAQRMYSINHEEQNILTLARGKDLPSSPATLRLAEKEIPDSGTPLIGKIRPVERQLLANDEICLVAASLAGVQQEAVAAMTEYLRLLASREYGNLDELPASLQTPCYLSRFVYAPARHLQFGLPVFETDNRGYTRILVNYSDAEQLPAGLFTVPADYHRISLDVD